MRTQTKGMLDGIVREIVPIAQEAVGGGAPARRAHARDLAGSLCGFLVARMFVGRLSCIRKISARARRLFF